MNRSIKYTSFLAISIGIFISLAKIMQDSFYHLERFWMVIIIAVAIIFYILIMKRMFKFIEKNKHLNNKVILWIIAIFIGTAIYILFRLIVLYIYTFLFYF